jgi:hypothetical protein
MDLAPSVMDWANVFWGASVFSAVVGGGVSLVAFTVSKRGNNGEKERRKVHILYLVSYIFMSVSIFIIAFRGLLQ